jgi:hypothetical protein
MGEREFLCTYLSFYHLHKIIQLSICCHGPRPQHASNIIRLLSSGCGCRCSRRLAAAPLGTPALAAASGTDSYDSCLPGSVGCLSSSAAGSQAGLPDGLAEGLHAQQVLHGGPAQHEEKAGECCC